MGIMQLRGGSKFVAVDQKNSLLQSEKLKQYDDMQFSTSSTYSANPDDVTEELVLDDDLACVNSGCNETIQNVQSPCTALDTQTLSFISTRSSCSTAPVIKDMDLLEKSPVGPAFRDFAKNVQYGDQLLLKSIRPREMTARLLSTPSMKEVPQRLLTDPARITERVGRALQMLADRSGEWTDRVRALQDLRSLISNSSSLMEFPDATALVQRVVESLCCQLEDKRSLLVKECCLSVSAVAGMLCACWPAGISKLLQALLPLTFVTVKVISAAGHKCITSLCSELPVQVLLPDIDRGLADDHIQTRARCSEYISQILRDRSAQELRDHAVILGELVVRSLSDNAVAVRTAGKEAFAHLCRVLPEQTQAVLTQISPAMRGQLSRNLTMHSDSVAIPRATSSALLVGVRDLRQGESPLIENGRRGTPNEENTNDFSPYRVRPSGKSIIPESARNLPLVQTPDSSFLLAPPIRAEIVQRRPFQSIQTSVLESMTIPSLLQQPPFQKDWLADTRQPSWEGQDLRELGRQIDTTLRGMKLHFPGGDSDSDEDRKAGLSAISDMNLVNQQPWTRTLSSQEATDGADPSVQEEATKSMREGCENVNLTTNAIQKSPGLESKSRIHSAALFCNEIRRDWQSKVDTDGEIIPIKNVSLTSASESSLQRMMTSSHVTLIRDDKSEIGEDCVAEHHLIPSLQLNSCKASQAAKPAASLSNRVRRTRPLRARIPSNFVQAERLSTNSSSLQPTLETYMMGACDNASGTTTNGSHGILGSLLLACDDYVLSVLPPSHPAHSSNSSAFKMEWGRPPREQLEKELLECKAVAAVLWDSLCRTNAEAKVRGAALEWIMSLLFGLQAVHIFSNSTLPQAGVQVSPPVTMSCAAFDDNSHENEDAYEADRRRRIERNRQALADFGLTASPLRPQRASQNRGPVATVDSSGHIESDGKESDDTYSADGSESNDEDFDAGENQETDETDRDSTKNVHVDFNKLESKRKSGQNTNIPDSHVKSVDPDADGLVPAQRFRREMAKAAYESGGGTSQAEAFLESSLPSVVARAFREVGWTDARCSASERSENSNGPESQRVEIDEEIRRRRHKRQPMRAAANRALLDEESNDSEALSGCLGRASGSGGSGSTSSARKRIRSLSCGRDDHSEASDREHRPTATLTEGREDEELHERGIWCRRPGVRGKYYSVQNRYLCSNCGRAGHVRRTCDMPAGVLDTAMQALGWQVTEVIRKNGISREKFYITPGRHKQLRGLAKLLAHLREAGNSLEDIYAAAAATPGLPSGAKVV